MPGSSEGAPSTCTLFGPPDKMMAAGFRSATSAAVMRWGTISEYTSQLAHPTGDQLGVLGAEVDDQNCRPVWRPASGPAGVDVVMLRLTQGCES